MVLTGQNTHGYMHILLRSESPSGKFAKIHTVIASNNKDHAPQSLYYWLFVPHTVYMGVVLRAHAVRGESHIQRNANGEVATTSVWRGSTVSWSTPSDPKNKKNYKQYSAVAQLRWGQGPQFKINWLCFLVTDIRTMQIFLWLLHVSSPWFSFYDFILSLTILLHTWLLSNLAQVTMNTRKKLRLAWDLSSQTSISIFDKRYMSKTYNIQARI